MRIGHARPSSAFLGVREPVDKTDAGAFPAPGAVAVSTRFSVVSSVGPAGRHPRDGEVSTVELLVARCAGLDVAKDEVVACARVPDGRGGRDQELRTFPSFTSGLEALAGWLAGEEIIQVVMEATGSTGSPSGMCWRSGALSCCWSTPATSSFCPAPRPMSVTPPGWPSCWSMGCCGAALCHQRPSGSCGI
jgi:hypothetical protein